LLAPFSVTTTADTGAGSLRQAILDANTAVGADTISFNISGAGVKTISLASALPNITEAVTIDGKTQSGSSPTTLMIELNGASAGPGANGSRLTPAHLPFADCDQSLRRHRHQVNTAPTARSG
jgi:hypothetical protein